MSIAGKLSLIAKNQRNIYVAGRAASKKIAKIVDGTIEEVTEEDLAGVTKIKQATFLFCNKLKSVSLPSTIETIGKQAFESCTGLESIILPASVTSIEKSAFYKCASLKSVTVLATTPPALASIAFEYCPTDMIIRVPPESKSAYKAATNWSARADMIIGIGEELSQEPTTNVYCCASDYTGEYVEGFPLFDWQSSLVLPDTAEFNCTSQCSHCNNTVYMVGGMAAPEYLQVQTCPYCGTYGTLPEPTYH